MKLPLAFFLVLFLVFQIPDLHHGSGTTMADEVAIKDKTIVGNGTAMADEVAIKDKTIVGMNLYNARSMQNSSFGSVEETNGRNNSTNATFMDLDASGQDFSSNHSADEENTGKTEMSFFHDDAEGIIIIFIIAIIIAGIFLFPVFNHCRKSYFGKKPVTAQGQIYYLPRYQELLQRADL